MTADPPHDATNVEADYDPLLLSSYDGRWPLNRSTTHNCQMPASGWRYRCPLCDTTWRRSTSPVHGSDTWTATHGLRRWLTR